MLRSERRLAVSPVVTERGRQGFVLAAALLSTLLIAALMAATFFAATEETRTAVATTMSENALADAESAVAATIGAMANRSVLPPGLGQTTIQGDASGRWSVHVTRLDSTLLWIVGEATSDRGMLGTTRRVGVLAAIAIDPAGSMRVSLIPERGWSELF